ncbi:MAG: hypothetical protein ACTHLE_08010 [Agriterribacter sp.]
MKHTLLVLFILLNACEPAGREPTAVDSAEAVNEKREELANRPEAVVADENVSDFLVQAAGNAQQQLQLSRIIGQKATDAALLNIAKTIASTQDYILKKAEAIAFSYQVTLPDSVTQRADVKGIQQWDDYFDNSRHLLQQSISLYEAADGKITNQQVLQMIDSVLPKLRQDMELLKKTGKK